MIITGQYRRNHISRLFERTAEHTSDFIAGTLAARWRLLPRELSDLERQGVDQSLLRDELPIRAGNVVWIGADRFELEAVPRNPWSYQQERAFLILVKDRDDCPIDIVAWQPLTGRLGTWLGSAWALGQGSVFKPRLSEALPVYRSPLNWLRSRGKGIVILNYRMALLHLDAAGPLLAEDEQHRAELEAALTPPTPRILVASNAKGVWR